MRRRPGRRRRRLCSWRVAGRTQPAGSSPALGFAGYLAGRRQRGCSCPKGAARRGRARWLLLHGWSSPSTSATCCRCSSFPAAAVSRNRASAGCSFRQDEDRQASAERDQRADRPGFHENEILARLDPLTKRSPVRETCSASGPSIRLGISLRVASSSSSSSTALSSGVLTRAPPHTRALRCQPDGARAGRPRQRDHGRGRCRWHRRARAASGFAPPLSAFVLEREL